jgi:hypothetical protein
MVEENSFGMTGHVIRVILIRIIYRVGVNLNTLTVDFMMENGQIIKRMERVPTIGQTAEYIRASLKMIIKMDMEYFRFKMEENIKVDGCKINKMEMVFSF